jgi:glycosyltransferase involved in cell wall biosynthesis
MTSTSHVRETMDLRTMTSELPTVGHTAIRVCMLAYAFYESDTRILQYATALTQRGDAVDVIALRRDKSSPRFEVLNGVNVYRIQTRTVNERGLLAYSTRIMRFFFRSMIFLHRRNAKHPYDAVHVHNIPDFLVFAALSSKMKKIPVILDIHDLLPEFYASKFKINHSSLSFKLALIVERCSAAFADHMIIANHVWRDRYAARSSRTEKCSVVRNHPDLNIFTKHPGRPPKEGGRFQLIYPGSLNWHQGLDIAIRAFASIESQMPDAEFHIYGEGPAKPVLIELASQLRQQHRIFFHAFLPSNEIAQLMAMADLAIEPKRTNSVFSNEALSTKILEFMSLGVPVIACRTRIHAYYYDDSIIQYYENDDEAELAEQMVRLRNNPRIRAKLSENALKHVEDNTWNARKHEYLALVDSLVCRQNDARWHVSQK